MTCSAHHPFSWPPCLWLLMSWQNPWLPLVLDKSEKDSTSASQVTFGKFEEEAGECLCTTQGHYSLLLNIHASLLPSSWDQQRKHPSSISISWQLPPGAFDVRSCFIRSAITPLTHVSPTAFQPGWIRAYQSIRVMAGRERYHRINNFIDLEIYRER